MSRARLPILALALVAAMLVPPLAGAHIERSSYWPDPAVDGAVTPSAGGTVPSPRSLSSALRRSSRSDTFVVCQPASLRRALRSIRGARRDGYRLRPTQPLRRLSARRAGRLADVNRELYRRCRFRSLQDAVYRAGNNDRIVLMPGVYIEAQSRRAPSHDERCAQYQEQSEERAGAPTYRYHVECPNDQQLVFIQGRALAGDPPNPPHENRRGIPDAGRCIRCNLQIEGSGVVPEDVRLEIAKDWRDAPLRGPAEGVKDVGIRADRTDGIVIRNLTTAHAEEHGVYLQEVDGYLIERYKAFYNKEYGALMFTSDHGVVRDCEGMGQGDSAVYPGAAPDTAEQSEEPTPRLNQLITRCDIHHNTLGYSGTMANGTNVVDNNFYDNSTGLATDSFFAGGHPGYPQDGAVFERNRFYSNNFNSYAADSDVEPKVPVPVGTGIIIGGGNGNTIRENYFYDNWRRGVMLMTVPDAVSDRYDSYGSTSHRNRIYGNVMGRSPDGQLKPNGLDFWWDHYPGNEDNCWYENGEGFTSDPPPALLPSNCDNTSSGATYGAKSEELGGCAASVAVRETYDPDMCPWFTSPPPPEGSGSEMSGSGRAAALRAAAGHDFARIFQEACDLIGGSTLSCTPFAASRP